MRVRVVSVVFRAGDAVVRWSEALRSAWDASAPGPGDRLVVVAVDNASGDGTPERLQRHAPWIELRRQFANRGFAAGCNAGIATAEPDELLVILNPDVEVGQDFFRRLALLDWPERLAARGPAVRTPDGGIEQSARGFPRLATGIFGRTSLIARVLPGSRAVRRELQADPGAGAQDVDWVSGACMIVPVERVKRVGVFDEGYFMYWEDADWCRRARDLGLVISYEPSLEVIHRQGSSSAHRPFATNIAFHRSAWRYYDRHVASSRLASGFAAVALGARALVKVVALAVSRPRSPRWPGASVSVPDERCKAREAEDLGDGGADRRT